MKKYNRQLRDLIAAGKSEPSFIVSQELPLDSAPDAYEHFDKALTLRGAQQHGHRYIPEILERMSRDEICESPQVRPGSTAEEHFERRVPFLPSATAVSTGPGRPRRYSMDPTATMTMRRPPVEVYIAP